MYRIGLTGGIASGKSLVADYFAELGVPIVDTDVIAREIVAPGMPALRDIQSAFGDSVLSAKGTLDRREMRRIIFSDDDARATLEAILHPRIREEALRQANAGDGPYVIIVVPLLFESPLRDEMDRIVVVDCSEETQIRRLLDRDAESLEQAQRIIASQASRDERLSIADDLINNDASRDQTQARVADLHNKFMALAANGSGN